MNKFDLDKILSSDYGEVLSSDLETVLWHESSDFSGSIIQDYPIGYPCFDGEVYYDFLATFLNMAV